MLQSDEIILKILLKAQNDGNTLLKHFKIGYPSKQVVQESNSIFVGAVDSESNIEGFDFSSFTETLPFLSPSCPYQLVITPKQFFLLYGRKTSLASQTIYSL